MHVLCSPGDIRMQSFLGTSVLCLLLVADARTAIVPPPWANPSSNPCASQPRGWQLLYWPDDGKCYKIFQIGAPCPETMELGPSARGGGTVAECKCPPGTAQSPRDALCHPIFSRAACDWGQYFAPVPETPGSAGSKRRWGVCLSAEACPSKGEIYWPRDGKCYPRLTRGPCPRGELLTLSEEDGLAHCSCTIDGELGRYHWPGGEGGCYEHYTRGPCSETGELFLPGGYCGCNSGLPHYHAETGACYPLGGIGPCKPGHNFVVTTPRNESSNLAETTTIRARCVCKSGHALYSNGVCYRLHTQGPCDRGEMLVNATSCLPVPCKRGRLYFPTEKTCYRIGSKGPCPNGQIVLYDREVRPSLDGVGYNGICGCTNDLRNSGKCTDEPSADYEDPPSCESTPGAVLFNGTCQRLYTQGPCSTGEWLVARRDTRESLWQATEPARSRARCECRPGYKRISDEPGADDVDDNVLTTGGNCQPPAVSLARFLNDRIKSVNF